MFLKYMVLLLGGLVFGAATSAGSIALMTKLGVVPRIIARFQLSSHIITAENAIILGAIAGCIVSVFPLGTWGNGTQTWWQGAILILVSLGAGTFVGGQAMALAEILNMFPILFRRAKLQVGLRWAVVALAVGKVVGSMWYFIFGYQSN